MRARTLAFLSVLFAFSAAARVQPRVPPVQPAPKINGFRGEFLSDLDDVQQKITDLTAAMPAEKYRWRPSSDVRSVSEVFMHIAGANRHR